MDDVLFLIHDEFGLVAVQAPDAAFAVIAGAAHIRAVHLARQAFAAAAPDGEHGVISRLHAGNILADLDHPAEHLVSDYQFFLAVGSAGPAAAGLFAVGAADADAQHL